MCKSASQAVLSRMQLALHATRRTPHGASRSVPAISAWSVTTRHAAFRYSRDARAHGHTTTTMHEYRVHLPPPADSTEKNMSFQRENISISTAFQSAPLRLVRTEKCVLSVLCLPPGMCLLMDAVEIQHPWWLLSA